MKLFSYVVEHDHGYAPNPENNICTLVHCKFKKRWQVRKNIVETAEKGDWILGTGANSTESCGNGKIIYLMRIDEKISFTKYLKDSRFKKRIDCVDNGEGNTFALISYTFYYFGSKAITINSLPSGLRTVDVEKYRQGYKYKDFSHSYILKFVSYFAKKYKIGAHAMPCKPIKTSGINIINTKKANCRAMSFTRKIYKATYCCKFGSAC